MVVVVVELVLVLVLVLVLALATLRAVHFLSLVDLKFDFDLDLNRSIRWRLSDQSDAGGGRSDDGDCGGGGGECGGGGGEDAEVVMLAIFPVAPSQWWLCLRARTLYHICTTPFEFTSVLPASEMALVLALTSSSSSQFSSNKGWRIPVDLGW